VDWYEQLQPDLIPQLRKNRDIRIGSANPGGFNGILRFNYMQAPFNNVAVRRAILTPVNQHHRQRSLRLWRVQGIVSLRHAVWS